MREAPAPPPPSARRNNRSRRWFRGGRRRIPGPFRRTPASGRAKESCSRAAPRHSRESGNPLRRSRKKNRANIAGDRLRIPAFAGMTSVCKDGSHCDGRSAEGFGAVKGNNSLIILRHSRESGNPLRRSRKKNRANIADGRLRIPAFAGMTSVCADDRLRIPAFAGMTSICADDRLRVPAFAGMTGICTDGRLRIPAFAGMTSICMAVRFPRTLFRGNDEERCGLSISLHALFAGMGKYYWRVIAFRCGEPFGAPDRRGESRPISSHARMQHDLRARMAGAVSPAPGGRAGCRGWRGGAPFPRRTGSPGPRKGRRPPPCPP